MDDNNPPSQLKELIELGSKTIEVERKYRVKADEWEAFVNLCKANNPIDEIIIEGPDTYFQKDDLVLRWRFSEDLSELTIKSRFYKNTTIVREESEVELADNSPRSVLHFLKRLGFKKLFRIRKSCHIFWFKDLDGEMCAVIYKVSCKGKKDQFFIELEAEKGLNIAKSKEMIRRWEKVFNLPAYRRINESLYEIYSGQTTKMVDKSEQSVCIKCGIKKNNSEFYPSWLKKLGSKCKTCCIEENTSESAMKKVTARCRIRRKTDLSYRLKLQIRNRVNHALKNKKKIGSAVTGLGCTVEDLKKYLEKKFYVHPKSGKAMTWSDWGWGEGKWQIDHIRPFHSFNLEDRVQFLSACHFSNLQPLWWEDHIEKTNHEKALRYATKT